MVRIPFLAALPLLSAVVAAPAAPAEPRPYGPQTRTERDLEARQGYYFQNWSEGGSNIRCNNGGGSSYTATWSSKGGFVCGKGWSFGGNR